LNLVLNLLLIPRYGAMGAAVGTMVTLIIFNIMKQAGLLLGTGISLFDREYVRVYVVLIAATVAMLAMQLIFNPPVLVGVVMVGVISLAVLRLNRDVLNVGNMFPELLRIPGMRWLLGTLWSLPCWNGHSARSLFPERTCAARWPAQIGAICCPRLSLSILCVWARRQVQVWRRWRGWGACRSWRMPRLWPIFCRSTGGAASR